MVVVVVVVVYWYIGIFNLIFYCLDTAMDPYTIPPKNFMFRGTNRPSAGLDTSSSPADGRRGRDSL